MPPARAGSTANCFSTYLNKTRQISLIQTRVLDIFWSSLHGVCVCAQLASGRPSLGKIKRCDWNHSSDIWMASHCRYSLQTCQLWDVPLFAFFTGQPRLKTVWSKFHWETPWTATQLCKGIMSKNAMSIYWVSMSKSAKTLEAQMQFLRGQPTFPLTFGRKTTK